MTPKSRRGGTPRSKVRTQVQFERAQYERLKRVAYEQHKSLSAVVRELIDQALAGDVIAQARAIREIRMAVVGSGRDVEGKTDLAERHDDYLYGSSRDDA